MLKKVSWSLCPLRAQRGKILSSMLHHQLGHNLHRCLRYQTKIDMHNRISITLVAIMLTCIVKISSNDANPAMANALRMKNSANMSKIKVRTRYLQTTRASLLMNTSNMGNTASAHAMTVAMVEKNNNVAIPKHSRAVGRTLRLKGIMNCRGLDCRNNCQWRRFTNVHGKKQSALDEVLSLARGMRECEMCDVGRISRPLDDCHSPCQRFQRIGRRGDMPSVAAEAWPCS